MRSALIGAVLVAGTLLTAMPLAAQDVWEPLDTGTTQDLNAVHFVSADVGYVAGASGTVLKTTDGGATWTDVSTGPSLEINDLYFFDAEVGLVVGEEGQIGRTEDGGATWALVPSGTSQTLYSVSFSGDVGIIGAGSQRILRSGDRGRTWAVVLDDFFGPPFYGAHMLSSADGFVAGQNLIFQPLVGLSNDGGFTWNLVSFYLNQNEGTLRDIYFLDDLRGITVGNTFDARGAISRSEDGGHTWATTLFPATEALYGVGFVTDETGYAVGAGGMILKTTDGGQSWAPEGSGTAATLNDVSIPTTTTAYAAGDGGTVLRGAIQPGGPLSLFVTPVDPPVEVLPGESFQFTVEVSNSGDEPITFDVWAEITNGGTGLSITRGPRTLTLTAGASRQATLTQGVPLQAPSGAYTYRVVAGTFPDDVFASDTFTATVLEGEAAHARSGAVGWDVPFDAFEVSRATLPPRYVLEQNYPNPFDPHTVIRYSLPEGTHVKLRVYNALGREVAVLVDGYRAPGQHEATFDASAFSAGLYLYRLEAGTFASARSMLLVK